MLYLPSRRLLEHLCWGLALLCGLGYVGGRALGGFEHRASLSAFDIESAAARSIALTLPSAMPDQASAASLRANGGLVPDTQSWAPSRINSFMRAQSVDASGDQAALAVLHIPRLSLRVPVYAEYNERNLNRGAAIFVTPAALASPGNLAIAGHRDGWFRALEQVELGDLIELQDVVSRRRFHISALSVVEPTDLAPLAATDEASLTLITCFPFYFVGSAPQRFIVRATLQQTLNRPYSGANDPVATATRGPAFSSAH